MNSRLPERAMVPMSRMTSSRLIPMPLSEIASVRALVSTSRRISSSPSGSRSGVVRPSRRMRSRASELFEISSRRKMSFWE